MNWRRRLILVSKSPAVQRNRKMGVSWRGSGGSEKDQWVSVRVNNVYGKHADSLARVLGWVSGSGTSCWGGGQSWLPKPKRKARRAVIVTGAEMGQCILTRALFCWLLFSQRKMLEVETKGLWKIHPSTSPISLPISRFFAIIPLKLASKLFQIKISIWRWVFIFS